MEQLTYEDYKDRIDIKDLLTYAGYRFNRRDGLRYPTFVKMDGTGHHVKGDKFIVTANGKCCFRPPEQKNYNVISFIKEHADLFPEYEYGMDKDRLVNLVCRKMLGQPADLGVSQVQDTLPDIRFDLNDYDIVKFDGEDQENMKMFYPYFRQRGIDPLTQKAFADNIWLSTNLRRSDGRRFTNMAFPFRTPLSNEVVGLEVRSIKHSDGSSFKGKALGTDSVNGLWIASPNRVTLKDAKDLFWFESAYDAMSYFQIIRKSMYEEKALVKEEFKDGDLTEYEMRQRLKELDVLLDRHKNAVYLSTGGSPSEQQFKGVLKANTEAWHYLCFDNDKAGRMYTFNFLMHRENRFFNSYTTPEGQLAFIDRTKPGQNDRFDFDPLRTTVNDFCQHLNLSTDNVIHMYPSPGYKDWNDQLLDNRQEQVEEQIVNEPEDRGVGLHR